MSTKSARVALAVLSTVGLACAGKPATEPLLAPPPAVPVAAPPVLTWTNWDAPDRSFSVDLPGEPQENRSSTRMDYGDAKVVRYLVDIDGTTLGIEVTEYPKQFVEGLPAGQLLALIRRRELDSLDGAIEDDRILPFSPPGQGGTALSGRRLVGRSQTMGMVSRSRWILNGTLLYKLTQSGPAETANAADFERLEASFRLRPTVEEPAVDQE